MTSSYHTAPGRLRVPARARDADGVEIIVRASRYDGPIPALVDAAAQDIRFIMSELPKLAAYLAGLGE